MTIYLIMIQWKDTGTSQFKTFWKRRFYKPTLLWRHCGWTITRITCTFSSNSIGWARVALFTATFYRWAKLERGFESVLTWRLSQSNYGLNWPIRGQVYIIISKTHLKQFFWHCWLEKIAFLICIFQRDLSRARSSDWCSSYGSDWCSSGSDLLFSRKWE